MKRIVAPTCSVSDLFDECVQGMSNAGLRDRLNAQKKLFEASNLEYATHSGSQTWCHLPKAAHAHPEQIIFGDLRKDELVDLYTTGMVRSRGAARKVYDQIKLLALGECPYCGGCGEFVDEDEGEDEDGIGTLDHFLPKARFPAFSILPANLVPACGVCNKGMGSSFPTDPNHQPLHPYFDAPHFFDEKWTTATISEEDPVTVSFGVNAPVMWDEKDKQRVLQHFKDCKLSQRYRAKVTFDLSSLVEQRKNSHRNLPPVEFRAILRDVADNTALPINGWRRTLYHSLAESGWFCSYDFSV